MCGIAGFFNRPENWKENIIKMNHRMRHRGPNAQGYWTNDDCSAVLGHARLSILDLSDAGSQPMVSHDGRYIMVLNGEIYNYKELEKKLLSEGKVCGFRGHSDTEVFLEYVAAYGFEAALKVGIGMFAVGGYDRQEKVLYLGRDRFGEKPLYYGFIEKSFVFASEIGCIYELADRKIEIDRDALSLFFLYGYIPAPYTIYKGIYKMEAGSILEIAEPYAEVREHKYWDIMETAQYGLSHRFQGTEADAADELERLLKQSIRRQMVADVPVGAFLSGGIDSSVVVAIMQSMSEQRVKTFSIGFEENEYNEAVFAKNTAEYLGTDHTELYVTPKDVTDIIPMMPYVYGEPFADSSQMPTYLVSKLAREKVTVSLSGDAGDELFCGYNNYFLIQTIWRRIKHIPMSLRRMGSAVLKLSPFQSREIRQIAVLLDSGCMEDIHIRTRDFTGYAEWLVQGGRIPKDKFSGYPFGFLRGEGIENVMLMDMLVYHPDDILVKVDRSAMAVSLESRVPFLDKDVVEFAFSLPHEYKADGKVGKKVLRDVLYRYVPKEMMDRSKKGFSIPVDRWIRDGMLREWAEERLNDNRIREQGILNPKAVQGLWKSFQANGKDGAKIWNLLMFQEWMGQNRKNM